MADLTSSLVAVNLKGAFLGPGHKDLTFKAVTLSTTDHGTLSSGKKIPASALGFASLVGCSNFMDATDVPYGGAVSYDGTNLTLFGPSGTDFVAVNATDSIKGTVWGYTS